MGVLLALGPLVSIGTAHAATVARPVGTATATPAQIAQEEQALLLKIAALSNALELAQAHELVATRTVAADLATVQRDRHQVVEAAVATYMEGPVSGVGQVLAEAVVRASDVDMTRFRLALANARATEAAARRAVTEAQATLARLQAARATLARQEAAAIARQQAQAAAARAAAEAAAQAAAARAAARAAAERAAAATAARLAAERSSPPASDPASTSSPAGGASASAGSASASGPPTADPAPPTGSPVAVNYLQATEAQMALMKKYPFGPVTARLPASLTVTSEVETGVASWYGPGFEGQPTASGAIFDENGWTCASPSLPLGTFLLVSANGRSVLLLVNDRGPYVGGRILDLTYAAAAYLGYVSAGVADVTATVVTPTPTSQGG